MKPKYEKKLYAFDNWLLRNFFDSAPACWMPLPYFCPLLERQSVDRFATLHVSC